jgi:protein associated with RNAse G/E
MDPVLRIRGIYATALTKFFLDRGFKVALPSGSMAERFAGWDGFDALQAPDVQILDLENKQGILMEGEEQVLQALLTRVRSEFFDAVTRSKAKDAIEIEFPLASKSHLDEIRSTVLLTLPLHHRLKIIAPERVDFIEQEVLPRQPDMKVSLSRNLEREIIWNGYERGKEIAIEHVKLDGRVFHLSEGEVVEADFTTKKLVLKRFKFRGRSSYDGLGIPKQEGDYAVSEILGGNWYYRHAYYRMQGERIGTYYNINTPVEFYPTRIRYVDLEVDVVHFPDGKVEVVDEGKLEEQFEQGYLSEKMREKAIKEGSLLSTSLLSNHGSMNL